MDAEAIMTVSTAVVALTQFAKWLGVSDRHGPMLVLVLAAVGVAIWSFAHGAIPRAETFSYFAGWIAVATSAAGVFGFTRAAGTAVTHGSPPPPAENSTKPARPT